MSFWTTETLRSRGRRLIDPFHPEQVVNCAYELTLGPEGYVTSSNRGLRRLIKRVLGRRRIAKKKVLLDGKGRDAQLIIPPGQFALLLTEETVAIPNTAIGLISVRSSFKLRGLVNVSGFHVDPGFKGRLIFSVYNAGGRDAMVSRGDRMFLLWYVALESRTADAYAGSRNNQMTIPNADIMEIGLAHYSPGEVNERLTDVEVRVRLLMGILITVIGTILASLIFFGIQRVLDAGRDIQPAPGAPSISPTTPAPTIPLSPRSSPRP